MYFDLEGLLVYTLAISSRLVQVYGGKLPGNDSPVPDPPVCSLIMTLSAHGMCSLHSPSKHLRPLRVAGENLHQRKGPAVNIEGPVREEIMANDPRSRTEEPASSGSLATVECSTQW